MPDPFANYVPRSESPSNMRKSFRIGNRDVRRSSNYNNNYENWADFGNMLMSTNPSERYGSNMFNPEYNPYASGIAGENIGQTATGYANFLRNKQYNVDEVAAGTGAGKVDSILDKTGGVASGIAGLAGGPLAAGITSTVFGIGSLVASELAEKQAEKRIAAMREKDKMNAGTLESFSKRVSDEYNNPYTSNTDYAPTFKYGGFRRKKLGAGGYGSLVRFEGPKHKPEGAAGASGIPLGSEAEVEGGEVEGTYGDTKGYIFSKRLGAAKEALKVEDKYKLRPEDNVELNTKNIFLKAIMAKSEAKKLKMGIDSAGNPINPATEQLQGTEQYQPSEEEMAMMMQGQGLPQGMPMQQMGQPGMEQQFAYGGNLSKYKAKKMLEDNSANGQPLSEAQKKLFRAVAHGWQPKAFGGFVNKVAEDNMTTNLYAYGGKKPPYTYVNPQDTLPLMTGMEYLNYQIDNDWPGLNDYSQQAGTQRSSLSRRRAIPYDPTGRMVNMATGQVTFPYGQSTGGGTQRVQTNAIPQVSRVGANKVMATQGQDELPPLGTVGTFPIGGARGLTEYAYDWNPAVTNKNFSAGSPFDAMNTSQVGKMGPPTYEDWQSKFPTSTLTPQQLALRSQADNVPDITNPQGQGGGFGDFMSQYGYMIPGALASTVGDIYDLRRGMKGGDEVNFQRVMPRYVNYEPARLEALRQANTATEQNRYALRNAGLSKGQMIGNTLASNASIREGLAGNIGNIYMQQGAQNAGIFNQVQGMNAQIAMNESIARQQEEDAARSAVSAGLHGLAGKAQGISRDMIDTWNQRRIMEKYIQTQDYGYDKNGNPTYRSYNPETQQYIVTTGAELDKLKLEWEKKGLIDKTGRIINKSTAKSESKVTNKQ